MNATSDKPFGLDYVRYTDAVETIEPDEEETFAKIIRVMGDAGEVTRQRYGKAVRTSHAKAHGLLRGELRVRAGLPEPLAQGLFADPRIYPVIVRLAHVPGELLDDRKVSTPRGMAIKVLDVTGPVLPAQGAAATQDFVLDTGKTFNTPGAKTFLAQITLTAEVAPKLPTSVKGFVSTVSRVTNEALTAVGVNSPNIDFFGHPFHHPLGEAYYSQTAFRYGDYIAKMSVTPDTSALRALMQKDLDLTDENGLRLAVVQYFRTNPAEYEVGIQLCIDLEKMPVEDAHKEWSEEESPYQPVARLVFPPQDAYSAARERRIDDGLLFAPGHTMVAHRPLGSLSRARMKVYEVLGNARRQQNGVALVEPKSIDEIPE